MPGGFEPNGELRFILAQLLEDYPKSMNDVMAKFYKSRIEHGKWFPGPRYVGDSETDYLKFLGEIKQMAKRIEAPDADFGHEPKKRKMNIDKVAETPKPY